MHNHRNQRTGRGVGIYLASELKFKHCNEYNV